MNAGPYSDAFEPRDFQARLISTVLDRHEAGERLTVAVASPGSGKTLAYQAIATELIRAGVIDYVAAYAPRIALAAQCEIEYRSADDQGHYSLFDPAARLESIQHRENKPPLTQPGAKRVGYVTTYASLVTDPAVHLDWARKHEGRFLLVGDEAQFLGSDDEDEQMGGTKAGGHFRELSDYAAHTILLTGTEKRADGKRLVLAQYEERDGYEYLQADERATHSDGMDQGYLRGVEVTYVQAMVRRTTEGETTETPLALDSSQLGQILRQQHVWSNVADETVRQLRIAQNVDQRFKGLIACQDQSSAESVRDYLVSQGVRTDLSISRDGDEASKVLDSFKFNHSDILVTVRKAFLGYDCKSITVVGLLTNYRDHGHLMQLVGRGLRVVDDLPLDKQWCRVVAPDDPGMVEFVETLKLESPQGVKVNDGTILCGGGEGPGGTLPPSTIVEDAWTVGIAATGHSGSVAGDDIATARALQDQFPFLAYLTQAQVAEVARSASGNAQPEPERLKFQRPSRGPRLTNKQLVAKYLSDADKQLKKYASSRVRYKDDPRLWMAIKRDCNVMINKRLGVRGTSEIREADMAQRYLEMAGAFGAAEDAA